MGKNHSTLTIDRLKESLNYCPDTGIFTRLATVGRCDRWKAGSEVGHLTKHGYIQIWLDGKSYLAHRLAWFYVTGEWPKELLDHADGDRSNNRICNLRECDDALNMQNIRRAHSDNSTGLLGVKRLGSGRFWARIFVDKKEVSLGVFDTPEDAHEAYLTAKRENHQFCTI